MSKEEHLLNRVGIAPLSELLPDFLMLAQIRHNNEIATWAMQEIGGYFTDGSASNEELLIPDYRIVVGQFIDVYGRPLLFSDRKLAFINEYRLGESVAALEKLEKHDGLIAIDDLRATKLIEEHLKVSVRRFTFGPVAVTGILANIRQKLILHLQTLQETGTYARRISNSHEMVPEKPKRWWQRVTRPSDLCALHPVVIKVASGLYQDGHYRQAILDTFIALNERVQIRSGRSDLDGTALMQTVFSAKAPIIRLGEGPDEQLGFMWMFSGAMMALRNPMAHSLNHSVTKQQTLDGLAFASALLQLLDE